MGPSNRTRKGSLLLGAGIVLVLLLYAGQTSLSLIPGFEGMQNGIWGYQPSGGSPSQIGEALTTPRGACSYSWEGSPTVGGAEVRAVSPYGLLGCGTLPLSNSLVIDAQENPVAYSDPLTAPISVNYYVPVPGATGQYQYVTGAVKEYTYRLDFSVASGSQGVWSFSGDTVWFNLASVVWDQASTCPCNSSITGSVFEAPLYAVVKDVQWSNQGSSNLDASLVGHAFSFYTSPSTQGQTLASLVQGGAVSSINSTLSSVYAPDTRMQRLVYYPVTIQDMQAQCSIGCSYPSVQITVKLYTLRIGEYILTNPDTTSLKLRSQGCTGLVCVGDALHAWLSNPLNLAGLGVFGLLAVAVVVVVVIAVTMPELVFLGRRRGEGE